MLWNVVILFYWIGRRLTAVFLIFSQGTVDLVVADQLDGNAETTVAGERVGFVLTRITMAFIRKVCTVNSDITDLAGLLFLQKVRTG